MSTSKHIDKICIVVASVMLVITVLFMFGETFGITVIHREEDESVNEMFTANDLNADWDTAESTEIVLNDNFAEISGKGAYFSNSILHIVYAGKYVIRGTLNGAIQIDADGDDKIWLLFDGVKMTSAEEAPLTIQQADKVFLTLAENSENVLTFENNDETSEIDGSIFSRDDLTINGSGKLTVTSNRHHGIVCNDSLVFAGGTINITAKKDAVHAHDAIKIRNTSLTISAGDDGLHAGNDNESAIFYFESGNLDVKESYEGIEANDITISGGTINIASSDDGINANGSGSASCMTISGGDISIINNKGKDADGLDSNGNIYITGGNLLISVTGTGTNNAVDYGSETGGRFIISGGTVIACGSSQMAESPDADSKQGTIMKTVSGKANDIVSVSDAKGKEIINKKIPCAFTSVIISCPEISVGDVVKLKIGNTETDITVSNDFKNNIDGPEKIETDSELSGSQNPFENGNAPNQTNDSDPSEKNEMIPQGDTPPAKPDETAKESQNAPDPEFQNSVPPEMPDGRPNENIQGAMPMPDEDAQEENRDKFSEPPSKNQNVRGDERNVSANQNADSQNEQSSEDSSATIMVCIAMSIVILAIGLLIALKKKSSV